MIVADVNVLIAAHKAEHIHHEPSLRYLTHVLTNETLLVPDAVWSGFLRIVTHPRILERPSTLAEASQFVRDVCGAPGYRVVGGLTDGIDILLELCADAEVTGNLIPDAYIAAVAIAYGCPVATFDRDFRRFDGVQIVTPQ